MPILAEHDQRHQRLHISLRCMPNVRDGEPTRNSNEPRHSRSTLGKDWHRSILQQRQRLVSCDCRLLQSDCELLWVQIDLTGAKSLHIGAFYRPPDSDVTTLENLNQSLQRLTRRTNGNIWLGGDFNAPHNNWPLLEVTPLAGTKRHIFERLIDISLHHNIEQIIDKQTKGENILDLFLTNNKSALQNFETLPPIGKADHDIVYIEINARPNRQKLLLLNATYPFFGTLTGME